MKTLAKADQDTATAYHEAGHGDRLANAVLGLAEALEEHELRRAA